MAKIEIVRWDKRDLEGLPGHVLGDIPLKDGLWRRRIAAIEYRRKNGMVVWSTIIFVM